MVMMVVVMMMGAIARTCSVAVVVWLRHDLLRNFSTDNTSAEN